jgi:cell wall-associated NlpC family hydrolase
MKPSHGLVTLAVLDVRRRPDHRSELTSQLLLGESVRLLAATPDRAWWRVENHADGYRGWVRAWGLLGLPAARASRWRRLARATVAARTVEATWRREAGGAGLPLVWGSRVIPGGRVGSRRAFLLPDGRRAWVAAGALRVAGRAPSIVRRVRGLLGIPYQWGGRSTFGFDCSGLTQQILFEQGVAIPRDARQQFRASRALARGEKPAVGDLAFFRGRSGRPEHVGLCLGGGYYAQSRGWVRISSLDQSNPLYDSGLDGTLMGIRRPTPLPAGRPRRVRGPGIE